MKPTQITIDQIISTRPDTKSSYNLIVFVLLKKIIENAHPVMELPMASTEHHQLLPIIGFTNTFTKLLLK